MTDLPGDLRLLAEPRDYGDTIKIVIARAARRAGLSYWRTFDIWYGKARRIEPHEREAIAAALQHKREEATRNELHDLRLRLTRLESILVQTDAQFRREDAAARRSPAGGLGGMGRALAPAKGRA